MYYYKNLYIPDFLTSMVPPSNLQNFTSEFDAFNNGIDSSLNASNLLNELMNTTYMNGTPTGVGSHLDAGTPPMATTTLFNDVADNMSNVSSGMYIKQLSSVRDILLVC